MGWLNFTSRKAANRTTFPGTVRISNLRAVRALSEQNWVLSDECEPFSVYPERRERCCQTNANQSQFAPKRRISGCAELTPLSQCGGAVELEIVPAVEVAFLVEMVMDGGMDGGEFLKTSHPSEAEHRPFSSSKWLV